MIHTDEQLVNVAMLRERAIELGRNFPRTTVSLRERLALGVLLTREMGDEHHPLLALVRDEVVDLDMPKYQLLVSWLAPYGLVVSYPNAVTRCALYLMGYTTKSEDKGIDWQSLHYAFPELSPHAS